MFRSINQLQTKQVASELSGIAPAESVLPLNTAYDLVAAAPKEVTKEEKVAENPSVASAKPASTSLESAKVGSRRLHIVRRSQIDQKAAEEKKAQASAVAEPSVQAPSVKDDFEKYGKSLVVSPKEAGSSDVSAMPVSLIPAPSVRFFQDKGCKYSTGGSFHMEESLAPQASVTKERVGKTKKKKAKVSRQRQEESYSEEFVTDEFFKALKARDISAMKLYLATAKVNINGKMGSLEDTPHYTPYSLYPSYMLFSPNTLHWLEVGTCGATPLFMAALLGYVDVVNFLIDAGAIIDFDCNSGLTALFVAITENHLEVVRTLLTRGAKIDQTTYDKSTPLHFALQKNNEPMVDLLLHYKADTNQSDDVGETPLIVSIMLYDNPNIVMKLINAGANVKKAKPNGVTPLFVAAQENRIQSLEILIKNGADVDAVRITDNMTPLQVAAYSGHLDVVKLLIIHGANIHHCCINGRNALFYAEANDSRNVASYLGSMLANVQTFFAHSAENSTIAYQQNFISDINFILDSNKYLCDENSSEWKFVNMLQISIDKLTDADDVYRKLSVALKSYTEEFKGVLEPMREIIIAKMHKYNSDKIMAETTVAILSKPSISAMQPKFK